jgi:hypothetical protein
VEIIGYRKGGMKGENSREAFVLLEKDSDCLGEDSSSRKGKINFGSRICL